MGQSNAAKRFLTKISNWQVAQRETFIPVSSGNEHLSVGLKKY